MGPEHTISAPDPLLRRETLMYRSLAVALALAASSTVATAQPTASLPLGFTFVDWLTVNNATVGIGAVDDDNTIYYLKEKQIGNLQSWLIFLDPEQSQMAAGTIVFSSPIVSLFTTTTQIVSQTRQYQLTPTVTYGADPRTGLENEDTASFLGNELTFFFGAIDPGDHVRVLTSVSVVPEPSTYALLATGLAALTAIARRRQQRTTR
jgi:hypothetical protein